MPNNPTAIVIDDDRDICGAFTEYLGMLGVRVLGVGYDGRQGFEVFQSTKPDMVFLDLAMPEYDGLYALQKIRKADRRAFVVIVTASSYEDAMLQTGHLWPNAIINKPADAKRIRQVIESRLAEIGAGAT